VRLKHLVRIWVDLLHWEQLAQKPLTNRRALGEREDRIGWSVIELLRCKSLST
jgi:hypothetical protein